MPLPAEYADFGRQPTRIVIMAPNHQWAEDYLRQHHPEINPRSSRVIYLTTYQKAVERLRGFRFDTGDAEFVNLGSPDHMCSEQIERVWAQLRYMGLEAVQ